MYSFFNAELKQSKNTTLYKSKQTETLVTQLEVYPSYTSSKTIAQNSSILILKTVC